MPRHVVSLIAMTLAGCVTTSRLSAMPEQLSQLASVNMYGPRQFVPVGQTEPVTVSRDDEIRLHTSKGTLPAAVSESTSDHAWAKISTLRVDPPRVSVAESPRISPSACEATNSCTMSTPLVESAALSEVKSADIQITRRNPWLTPLLITGAVLVVAAILVLPVVATLSANATRNYSCTPSSAGCLSFF